MAQALPAPGTNPFGGFWRIARPLLAAVQNVANVFAVLILWGSIFTPNVDIPTVFAWATVPVVVSLVVTLVFLVRTILGRNALTPTQLNRRLYGSAWALILEMGVLALMYGLNEYFGLPPEVILWIVRLGSLGIAGADLYYTGKLLS